MARLAKGILGAFSGTVGTVVGSTRNGVSCISSRPVRKRVQSSKQLPQQAKFRLAIQLVKGISDLVKNSFTHISVKETGFTAAVTHVLDNAITGTYPFYSINYSLVKVSEGKLPNVYSPAATITDRIIYFTWEDNSGLGTARQSDKSILVMYCPALDIWSYNSNGNTRSAQAASLNVSLFKNQSVQVYLGFTNEDETKMATSVYLGEMLVR